PGTAAPPRLARSRRGTGSGRRRLRLLRPPPQQVRSRRLLVDGPAVEAQLEQVLVRAPDDRAGPDPEDRHDLLPVEVGADGVELLLGLEVGDAALEVVVGLPQALGLAPVARGAVGAREAVQALEERAGVGHVPAHGRVGPRAVAVAVEPQVELDEARDVPDDLLVVPQRLE